MNNMYEIQNGVGFLIYNNGLSAISLNSINFITAKIINNDFINIYVNNIDADYCICTFSFNNITVDDVKQKAINIINTIYDHIKYKKDANLFINKLIF